MAHGTIVVPWVLPARSARGYISRAFEITVECCDHTFALYCKRNEATGMLFAGEFRRRTRYGGARAVIARDANFQLVIDGLLVQQMLLRRLQEGERDDHDVLPPQEAAGRRTLLISPTGSTGCRPHCCSAIFRVRSTRVGTLKLASIRRVRLPSGPICRSTVRSHCLRGPAAMRPRRLRCSAISRSSTSGRRPARRTSPRDASWCARSTRARTAGRWTRRKPMRAP